MDTTLGKVYESLGVFKNIRNGDISFSKEGYKDGSFCGMNYSNIIGAYALTVIARIYLDTDTVYLTVAFNQYQNNHVGDKEERKIKLSTLLKPNYLQDSVLSLIKKYNIPFKPTFESDYEKVRIGDFVNSLHDKRGTAKVSIFCRERYGPTELKFSVGTSGGQQLAFGKVLLNNNNYFIDRVTVYPRNKEVPSILHTQAYAVGVSINDFLMSYAEHVTEKSPHLYA